MPSMAKTLPVVTAELARRIQHAELEGLLARLRAWQLVDGDRYGVAIRRFGSAVALASKGGLSTCNRIVGVGPAEARHLPEILAWYRDLGVACRFDIAPPTSSESLLSALADEGLYQREFETVLYGVPPGTAGTAPCDVVIREVNVDETDLFIDTYMQAYEYRGSELRELFAIYHGTADLNRRDYFALVGGDIAGVGALYVSAGVASLDNAATLPSFRGRGCQIALLHRRLVDAARFGCDLVISQTEVSHHSQRNMERLGLRIAYTKAIWAERKRNQ